MNESADSGRRLGDSVDDGPRTASFGVDDEGIVIEWSTAAEELLGYPAQQALGRPVTVLATIEAPDEENADVVLRHRDGHLVGCRVRVSAVPEAGAVPHWKVDVSSIGVGDVLPGGEGSAAVDQALLEALFTRSPIGLFVLDPHLRLTRYNAAAEGMQGTRVTDGLGLRPTEAWPDFSAEVAERVMTEVLETGEPVLAFEKRGRPPGDPDREHVYSASAFRLEGPDGRILGIADLVVDVTKEHRAQERLALIAEAGSRIGTGLDVLRTAAELADVVVPRLADSVAVDLLEPVLAGEEVPDRSGETGWDLRRAASRSIRRHIQPGAYKVGDMSNFPDTAPAVQVLADRRPRLVRTVGADSRWVRGDEVRGRRMREEGVHSLMAVPLLARDCVLGLVTFYRWTARGAFEDDDLTLAQDLAARTAVALDNACHYLRERNTVLTLQRGLVPENLEVPQAVQAAHHWVQSGAGGDWTDVIALPGARVALVAGSTPGRGVHTAATMGRLRTAVHTMAALGLAPDELMARLDDLVHQMDAETAEPPAGSPVGATCLYLVYDPVTCECTTAAAGPPGLATVVPDGTVTFAEVPAGPPLGRPGPSFAKTTMQLPDECRLVLFTPGLLQAFTGADGCDDLVRLLSTSRESPQDLCLRLTEELVPADPPVDAAVLVANTRPLDPARVATWVLPADLEAVATARSLTARQLSAWAMDEEAFSTELIVSELVTNAIRYAKPPVQLRLIRGRTLSVEVSDGSSAAPHLRHARTTDEGGRGLLLVSQFAQRWGTRYEDRGKTIWAEEPLTEVA
ncbi:SpoIIE family protein phosphatase [Streptomyces sp. AcE210]|uniref:SpoIIE family protein phosphatase n=1 Tax=Streptomyces sp. AcE210 TaxID=2292703 RepID=UPI000E309A54|nr:SpoIIE family protein phosphatase [Streptomyces sp. AcE210]RFC78543.1 PAS domain S-box protein [Streptomyces sp. AcE210]